MRIRIQRTYEGTFDLEDDEIQELDDGRTDPWEIADGIADYELTQVDNQVDIVR